MESNMEKQKVVVAFKTATRKFAAGDEVGPSDIDGALTFEQCQELGLIDKPAPAATKPTKSKD
jgi:hypothetical protein